MENREKYQTAADQYPLLHLRLSLTPGCHVDLKITGQIDQEAIDRLVAFLKLVVPESKKAEEKEEESR